MDTRKKSILKSISWRVVGMGITMLIAYLLTDSVDIALSIGTLDAAVKIAIYYLHERIWNVY